MAGAPISITGATWIYGTPDPSPPPCAEFGSITLLEMKLEPAPPPRLAVTSPHALGPVQISNPVTPPPPPKYPPPPGPASPHLPGWPQGYGARLAALPPAPPLGPDPGEPATLLLNVSCW
ncbi:MAG: hypothetical protein JO304_19740 [Solirubrobacterales bacterium]|nr:hypothetical protein [Solirubrobacterales bacterium]